MMTLRIIFLSLVILGLSPTPAHASESRWTAKRVWKIAESIRVFRPKMSQVKALEFAMGILRATERYEIEPFVLVAITQQESAFRENLPEGPAGEIGICQVLKRWLKDEQFQAEFGKLTVADLQKPAMNFRAASWILKKLKARKELGALPYWSHYNSRKFENRFKYFLRVNKHVAALRVATPAVYNWDSKVYAKADPVTTPREQTFVVPTRTLASVIR